MERATSGPFSMPIKLPKLLDLGPLSPPIQREHTYAPPTPYSRSPSRPPVNFPSTRPPVHPAYPLSSVFDSSSDSDDSSDSDEPLPPSGLRTSVAALPESKLRCIMVKLADSNPRFHRAIMKELACAREFTGDAVDSPPQTPIRSDKGQRRRTPRARKEHRQEWDEDSEDRPLARETQRNFKNLSVTTVDHACVHQESTVVHSDEISLEEYAYHPGHLDEEVYEFFSPSTNHEPCKVVRTVTMWTCCDEDEWSPGCVSVPAFADHSLHDRDSQVMMRLSDSPAFPDSDLEHRYDLENSINLQAATSPGYGYRTG